MSAPRRPSCLIPGALALLLSGCSSLSEPAQQPPQTTGMSVPSPAAAEREKAEAEREAVEYQTHVAQMRIAGNFFDTPPSVYSLGGVTVTLTVRVEWAGTVTFLVEKATLVFNPAKYLGSALGPPVPTGLVSEDSS